MFENRNKLREMNSKALDTSSTSIRDILGFPAYDEKAIYTLDITDLSLDAEIEALCMFGSTNYSPILCSASSRNTDMQFAMDNFGTAANCIKYILNEASDDIYLAAVFYGAYALQDRHSSLQKFKKLITALVDDE